MPIMPSIAQALSLNLRNVEAVVKLLDTGNTIPFISRYRKEATGGLDEEQVFLIQEELGRMRQLEDRRETVLKSIDTQGILTPDLREKIIAAQSRSELEDIYQPYKPKRKTRASQARERGLQPLAEIILEQPIDYPNLNTVIASTLSEDVLTPEEAWAGACDIVAEMMSDHADVRQEVRKKAQKWGLLICRKNDDGQDNKRLYQHYYDFKIQVGRIRPHQILAINRGEDEKILHVSVDIPERDWRGAIFSNFRLDRRSKFSEQILAASEDAARRLLLPAIERDIRRSLTERAEEHAIKVFADNLRALLTQPPMTGYTVLAIDPGLRTGCKIAVVDPTGKLLATETIYPHEPQKHVELAIRTIEGLVHKHGVNLVAIGNGTASRETEELVARITSAKTELNYLIVSEAGASVYSASALARAELPRLDVSLRGAVSIARRVQDPLAELVKINPKSIGVGMYQHDINQTELSKALDYVVSSVVNQVGVDLNTSSPSLLAYISGIGPKLAEKIISFRENNGPFVNRISLLNVPGLGQKAYEQCAGFLRIRDGNQPLDATAIHPESYSEAESLLKELTLSLDLPFSERKQILEQAKQEERIEGLAKKLDIGLPTLLDIIEQLIQPGKDPREDLPKPSLRKDVLKLEDLVLGMELKGTVRNVIDFGAFVDIGVKQDALLHSSQIPSGVILQVGNLIDVRVINVDYDRGRIALSL